MFPPPRAAVSGPEMYWTSVPLLRLFLLPLADGLRRTAAALREALVFELSSFESRPRHALFFPVSASEKTGERERGLHACLCLVVVSESLLA